MQSSRRTSRLYGKRRLEGDDPRFDLAPGLTASAAALAMQHRKLVLEVELLGIEAGGTGTGLGQHAATLAYGTPGVLHGTMSYLIQNADGQVIETHSVSAGLDYPGVGPEHALLHATGRGTYLACTDDEALDALQEVCRLEGILPAIETAHAFFGARRWAKDNPGKRILIGCSGRGHKDLGILEQHEVGSVGRLQRGPAVQGQVTEPLGERRAEDAGRPHLVHGRESIASNEGVAEGVR